MSANFYIEFAVTAAGRGGYLTFAVGIVDHAYCEPENSLLNSFEHLNVSEILITNDVFAHLLIMAYREGCDHLTRIETC